MTTTTTTTTTSEKPEKQRTRVIYALLRYNWKGLAAATGAAYVSVSTAITQTLPSVPVKYAYVGAGLCAAGVAIGFFVQTFRPDGVTLLGGDPAPSGDPYGTDSASGDPADGSGTTFTPTPGGIPHMVGAVAVGIATEAVADEAEEFTDRAADRMGAAADNMLSDIPFRPGSAAEEMVKDAVEDAQDAIRGVDDKLVEELSVAIASVLAKREMRP